MERILMDKTINEYIPIVVKEADKEGKKWKVLVIQTGLSKNGNLYTQEVLQNSAKKFNNVKVFAYEFSGKYFEHLPENLELDKGYIKNLVGDLNDCRFEEIDENTSGIVADLNVYNDFYRKLFKNMYDEGKMDVVGFSAVMEAEVEPEYYQNKQINDVKQIYNVKSVDVVSSPAAGGRILNIIESQRRKEVEKEKIIKNIEALAPELLEGKNIESIEENELIDLLAEAVEKSLESKKKNNPEDKKKEHETEESKEGVPEEILILNKIKELLKTKNTDEAMKMIDDFIKVKTKGYGYPSPSYGYPEPKESLDDIKKTMEELNSFKTMYYLERYLNESNLPEPVKEKIRKMFEGKTSTEEEIKKVIDMEKESLTKIVESLGVPYGFTGQDKTKVILDEYDKKQRAVDLMIGYKPNESEKSLYQGIKPYTGLREAYVDITKDYEVSFSPKHFLKLSESFPGGFVSTNFPQILGDAINKRLMKEYPMATLDLWRKFCSVVPVKDFNPQKIIRWGALGMLNKVTEANNYNEYTIGTGSLEEYATYSPDTKGVVISITRQMILSDNLKFVERIPTMITRAATRTINQFAFDLLLCYGGTSPAINGATIYDTNHLYDATNHRNLLTDALTYDSLLTAMKKMKLQYVDTMDSSSEVDYIGISPEYLIVPPELEPTALTLLNSDRIPGSVDNDVNILKGKLEVIVSPYLRGDSDNWYVVADPNETDTIEIGFVQGKETPEVIVQDNPLMGYVFNADKISYKVRYEFGGCVADYRAFIGSIVS